MPGYEFIGIGITERCNLSCPHCYSSAKKTSEGEFTTDELREIIDILAEIGVGYIGWTGGEPLLRKDLEELIVYAGELGIGSGITTNGIPLTRTRVESIAQSGVKAVQISLDGSTPEKNRRIRQARLEDFDLIINGLKYSIEAGITVNLAMVIGADTLDDVRDYIAMAEDLGVETVRFCGFVPQGFGKADEIQTRMGFGERLPELATLLDEELDREKPELRFDPAFGPLPPAYSFHKCIAGVGTFYISAPGNVYPCTGLLDDRFIAGNVHERPLKEILDDPAMRQVSSYDHSRIHGHCQSCQYFRVCRGACRGAVFAHTGDLDASFPPCLFRASLESN